MVDLDKQFAEMADISTEDSAYDFVIDGDLRVIAVPERGVVLGVEGDKDVNRVRFRMNRNYRDTDLSGFNIRINYRSAKGKINYFPVTEKTVTDDAIYFVWLVGADTVAAKGTIYFVARFFTAEEDGTITQEFNTTLGNACTLEGLAVDAQAEDKPVKDLLAQLEYDLKTYAAPFVEQVKTAKRDALDAIDTSKQGALNAVEKKGKGVLATIPEDYTNLNESVVQLKEDISKSNSDIDTIYSSISERINIDVATKNGYVNNDTGEIVEHSEYHYAEISVKSYERYEVSAYYYAPSKLSLAYFYDAKNALLGSAGAYADGIEESEYVQEYIVNIPADCAKMIVQSWGDKPILVDKLELKKQKTDTDNTEPLKNGYVPMHFTVSNGIWSNGTIVPHASYKAIVFACGGNEHYSIDTYMNGDAKMPVARFLNRAGTEIGTTDIITDTGPLYQYKIVTPKNCTKMIVNGYLQPSNWPYAIRKYIPGHLPLAEKNVVFLGDSIMHGLSNTAYTGGWRDWFCRFTGVTQIMCTAVSGATICDYDDTILNGNPLDTEHSNTLSNQVQSIINSPPSNPDFVDYILIFAGTNDHAILSEFQGGVTQFINTATNSYIDIDTVDRTRYDGAMRWVAEKLWGIFPRAKIYWITPIQGAEPIRQTRLQIMKSDYMQEIATWLACPVIDATRNSGIYGRYENANAIGKYLFDGLHPTGEGYKLLGEFIAKEVASRESY